MTEAKIVIVAIGALAIGFISCAVLLAWVMSQDKGESDAGGQS
jgi:hypothetical protein